MRASSPLDTPAEPGRAGAEWLRWLPGVRILREYQWPWLRQDVFAGLVLTTMLVPVGIAYAEASGVPGICGLYATIVPIAAYAIFGPSRILVLGPDSAPAASGRTTAMITDASAESGPRTRMRLGPKMA